MKHKKSLNIYYLLFFSFAFTIISLMDDLHPWSLILSNILK